MQVVELKRKLDEERDGYRLGFKSYALILSYNSFKIFNKNKGLIESIKKKETWCLPRRAATTSTVGSKASIKGIFLMKHFSTIFLADSVFSY